ncbi:integrase [Pseudomonas sp. 24 R 17]|uniref:integrase n=1 Tax=Pseudomonas sp. 24 R 17 TaxID=1844096 RepID=UPI0021150AA5|nr:integrase [Pseudomonas sp. 24 R 17]
MRRRWGLSGSDEYRGLRPGSKLVTTQKGQVFELAFKNRELDSGPELNRACDSLQQTVSGLYRQACIKQVSSHRGIRSLAAKVLAANGTVILGYACLDHSKAYMIISQEIIRGL